MILVEDDGFEPHLMKGEYAVIDLTDREPQHGELYAIKSISPFGRPYVKQIKSARMNITGPGAAASLVWFIEDLRGFRDTGERINGVPVLTGVSDGPYTTVNVRRRILGRVVGYSHTALGHRQVPSA